MRRMILFIGFFIGFSGCQSGGLDTSDCSNLPASSRIGLTVLVHRYSLMEVDDKGLSWSKADTIQAREHLETCLEKNLQKKNCDLRIVPAEEFRRIAFPDLDEPEIPCSPESIGLLLGHPEFQKRIAPLRVRYLVLVGGGTEHRHREGGVSLYGLGGAPGGAVVWFWGKAVWDNKSSLGAVVLDLETSLEAEDLHADATDESSFGMFLYVPYGAFSSASRDVCRNLVDQIYAAVQDMEHAQTDKKISGGAEGI